jgi:hypothetical protein
MVPTQPTCPLEVVELFSSVTVIAVTIKYINIKMLKKIHALSPQNMYFEAAYKSV